MSSPVFQVRVTKDYLVFCSGHFITYQGDQCERIHGHNYRTAVEVEGDLDENHYVIDFIALKDLTRSIIAELDHRMMLPTRSRHILLHEEGSNIRVTYGDRYWSFPRDECALVPIANTTAELLADYIAGRLHEAMKARGWHLPRVLRVEVEESFGQSARVEWRAEESAGPPERPAARSTSSPGPRPDPLQFVAPDASIVDRRSHQRGRSAQVLHLQHVIDPADTAAHADGDRRMMRPEPDKQVSRPDPPTRPHPREIQQDEGTDAAGDGPSGNLAWLLTGPRRASCEPRLPIIHVQAEDRSTGSDTPD